MHNIILIDIRQTKLSKLDGLLLAYITTFHQILGDNVTKKFL